MEKISGSTMRISITRLEYLNSRLEAMRDERTAYEEMLSAIPAIDYGKAKVQASLSKEPAFAKVSEKISRLDAQIDELSIEMMLLKSQIIECLYQLPKRQRVILFKRYVEFKSLTQVSSEMELSYRYTRFLCRKAEIAFFGLNQE